MRKLGIYIHVPFCGRACDFCNFYQEAPDRKAIDQYLEAIEREFVLWPPDRVAESVFIGGGTPGLLMADDFRKLGEIVLRANHGVPPKEWSVEMAPATVKENKLETMQALGVNRISMGVQSFDEKLLLALGRTHSAKQVYRAIDILKSSGFVNFNLDLIFAVPGQTMEQWEADLREAVRINPAHISTYCLTFEEDTALWLKLSRGQMVKHTEVEESQFYERTWAMLPELGFEQYEISNFAKPGFECRHNIDTWSMEEWIGYGPSASSQFRGRRYTRAYSLNEWSAGVLAGKPENVEDISVSEREIAVDALIFGLRMNSGVNMAIWRERFGSVIPSGLDEYLKHLSSNGILAYREKNIHLTRQGRLLADRIGSELLELLDCFESLRADEIAF